MIGVYGLRGPFVLDLSDLAEHWGSHRVQVTMHWFNPRDARCTPVDGKACTPVVGRHTFVPPSSGGVDHDWVLVVRANYDTY